MMVSVCETYVVARRQAAVKEIPTRNRDIANTFGVNIIFDEINTLPTSQSLANVLLGRTSSGNASRASYELIDENGDATLSNILSQKLLLQDSLTNSPTVDYTAVLHEMMHIIGGEHPGNYNGPGSNDSDVLNSTSDSLQFTILSYAQPNNPWDINTINNVLIDGDYISPQSLMIGDYIYLKDTFNINALNPGDNYYNFLESFSRAREYEFAYTIYDEGGNDTVNFSIFNGEHINRIDMRNGYSSDINGAENNFFIGFDTQIETIQASNTRDNIQGGEWSETMFAFYGNDTVYGNGGDDTIYGDVGNDSIFGGNDNDIIYDGSGNDVIEGGGGDDIFYAQGGIDQFDGGAGNDTLSFKESAAGITFNLQTSVHTGFAQTATVVNIENFEFTNMADDITGDTQNNYFEGLGGNDTIDGGSGNDKLFGGDDNDTIITGEGHDTAYGGNGDDFIDAKTDLSTDQAVIYGGDGHDIIKGSKGSDELYGENGNDNIEGSVGQDQIYGGNDNDTINGQGSDDSIYGGLGADIIDGGSGNDNVFGNENDDTLDGYTGTDLIYGGSGDDLINGGDDEDTLYGDQDNDVLYGGSESDTLYGNAGNDELHGEHGNEELYGGSGNDSLYGGLYADTLNGGADNDTLYGGHSNDILSGGSGDDYLYGDDGNDNLEGGSGYNHLYGGSGNDTFYGGDDGNYMRNHADNATMFGGSGVDKFAAGTQNVGTVIVKNFQDGTDKILIGQDLLIFDNIRQTETSLGHSSYVEEINGNTIINLNNGGTIVVENAINLNQWDWDFYYT